MWDSFHNGELSPLSGFLLYVNCTHLDHMIPPQVGSGYTMDELRQLGRQLQPYWKVYNPKKPPECLVLAAGHKVGRNINNVTYIYTNLLGEARFVD